jgi:methylmalonyl-CoA mutase cobalamin-binding subunit
MTRSHAPIQRSHIFPEAELPAASLLIEEGKQLAKRAGLGPSPFLSANNVECEIDYKRKCVAEGKLMLHAQFGFRDPNKSRRAFREIHERLDRAGYHVDRYGICLDWSMGYPAAQRQNMPRGTGLIIDSPEEFSILTSEAPVAPHFGDFVLGMPAAIENTVAALSAGSTAIGNLGQYFNFRLPHWDDDVGTTAATVQALALAAAQPVDILIHSNLDDGFAAQFQDLACVLGFVLLERYIVEELIGGTIGHCYGHTFSNPLTRLAFQRALARASPGPGTMIYGNTTSFGPSEAENFAVLAGYLLVDIAAQKSLPSGHAINPVPVTEAMRIPEIEEIIEAHLFCHRLIDRESILEPLLDLDAADDEAMKILDGGRQFKDSVLQGLEGAGIDTRNPLEILLALKRIGPKSLEQLFGPGKISPGAPGQRDPLVPSSVAGELEIAAERCLNSLDTEVVGRINAAGLAACLASTDVHEYGKVLVEAVLKKLNVRTVDAGISTDPDRLAATARDENADFIAVSTYCGFALSYFTKLRDEMAKRALEIPVFIGGKLNQIPDDSADSLPVDVSTDLAASGAIVCRTVEELLERLADFPGH